MRKKYHGSLNDVIKDIVPTNKKELDGKKGYGVAYWQYWVEKEIIGHDYWNSPIYGDFIECYGAGADYYESKEERDRIAVMIPKVTGICGEKKYGNMVENFTFTWKYEGKC